jgi:hypothetical protein
VDDRPNPLEQRPFVEELGDALRAAVDQLRTEPPPAASMARALERARRLGPGKVNPWLRYHRIAVTAAVAAVLMLTFGLLLICWRFEPGGPPPTPGPVVHVPGHKDDGGDIDVSVGDPASGRPRMGDGRPTESPFVAAESSPVSTFPLTVDPTAYSDLRRSLLEEKRLPDPDAVRVADLVNSFSYSYPEPTGDDPVSLTLDLAECPWNAAHLLARIGLRGRADAAAHEARVQVTFDARRVAAHRLIGWDGRRVASEAGETLTAGQAVTALYEITPAAHADNAEWLTVEMRCRDATGQAWVKQQTLSGGPRRFVEASADFRFAAAAAEFGLLLRGSAYRGDATYAAVRSTACDALGADADGRRAAFLALVDAADRLTADRKITRGLGTPTRVRRL